MKEDFKKIIEICDKHIKEGAIYLSEQTESYFEYIKYKAKEQYIKLDRSEKYNIEIPADAVYGTDYCKISEYISMAYYEDGKRALENNSGRYISMSIDGKQPLKEWLLSISFSPGPYVLGAEYPEKTFQTMRKEIKSYGYKYCDESNRKVYFSMDNCSEICGNLNSIIARYRTLAREEIKKNKKSMLEKQLAELED